MVVETSGAAGISQGTTRGAPTTLAASPRPVIDTQTIKAILYLGLKGDVSLGAASSGLAPTTRAGRSVDTYA